MSYQFARQQPLIVRLALIFCPAKTRQIENGWVFVFKRFRGREYLVTTYRRG